MATTWQNGSIYTLRTVHVLVTIVTISSDRNLIPWIIIFLNYLSKVFLETRIAVPYSDF